MVRIWWMVGSLAGFFAVALGAFAAHGLKHRLSAELLAAFETGARYQMFHALALLAVALLSSRAASPAASVAGWAFTLGILLFSGSLYLLALSGVRWLGAITPLGGVAFLVGWVALAVAAWQTVPGPS